MFSPANVSVEHIDRGVCGLGVAYDNFNQQTQSTTRECWLTSGQRGERVRGTRSSNFVSMLVSHESWVMDWVSISERKRIVMIFAARPKTPPLPTPTRSPTTGTFTTRTTEDSCELVRTEECEDDRHTRQRQVLKHPLSAIGESGGEPWHQTELEDASVSQTESSGWGASEWGPNETM